MNELIKEDFLSLDLAELQAKIVSYGFPKYRAKQIFDWMYKGKDFSQMINLPEKMREFLAGNASLNLPVIQKKLVSGIDGTAKYLLRLSDGNYIESVLMRYKYGLSICVSSQCGCRMGCRFCASTIGGKVRDLLPSEILGQIIAVSADCGERISHVVMMGIGEPLDNYDNVIAFLRLVNLPEGLNIGYRNISLSTCGLVPNILRLAKEKFPITLSVSLHASDDSTRSAIMPVNNRYPIAELLSACNSYQNDTGRRISFEYTLISGKNDSRAAAEKLAAILKKYMEKSVHVNLIPLNPVTERDFKTTTPAFAEAFCRTLLKNGVNATVRRTLGPDINASCGQLRRSETAKSDK